MIKNHMDLQELLFNKKLLRSNLLSYNEDRKFTTFKVKVYRNHSFEFISSVISPFLNYAQLNIIFSYSDYDDSLSFFNFNDKDVDAFLLWLDLNRYDKIDVTSFVNERISYLRKLTSKPILVGITGSKIKIYSKELIFYTEDLLPGCDFNFYDEEREPYTGTRISSRASVVIARELATKYFPFIFGKRMKAVIVDLDNTLYSGILGEDGIKNLILTNGHKQLQEYLVKMSSDGIFVCLASKNEYADVIALFQKRKDFPLRLEHFTCIKASWDYKSKSISEISNILNIGTDAILFVDDNIGEISSVLTSIPDVQFILANEDACKTLLALKYYPGFYKFDTSFEDSIRKNDIKANSIRSQLFNSMSQEEYLKDIKMELTFYIDNINEITRISELANKTNQFIFNYKRYTISALNKFFECRNNVCISIHLKDKLSDSGMIGSVFLSKVNDVAKLDELFISCRALGRGIDDLIISEAIRIGLETLNVNKLFASITKGPKNKPAQDFFFKYLQKYSDIQRYMSFAHNELISINIVSGEKNGR